MGNEVHDDIEKILISSEEIQEKIVHLAKQITEDYRDRDLLLVGVLKGAFVFMSDLAREIDPPIDFDFMAVSRTGRRRSRTGVVRTSRTRLRDKVATSTGRRPSSTRD